MTDQSDDLADVLLERVESAVASEKIERFQLWIEKGEAPRFGTNGNVWAFYSIKGKYMLPIGPVVSVEPLSWHLIPIWLTAAELRRKFERYEP